MDKLIKNDKYEMVQEQKRPKVHDLLDFFENSIMRSVGFLFNTQLISPCNIPADKDCDGCNCANDIENLRNRTNFCTFSCIGGQEAAQSKIRNMKRGIGSSKKDSEYK